MFPKSICFVDVETSGISPRFNRIIEIGIIKVVNGKVVKEFSSLVNPGSFVDPYIEGLTGISRDDLKRAPFFYEVKDELLEMFEDSVFAAHSVRFDYGFVRNEFRRLGVNFTAKHLCTVKLARLLYPNLKKFNLDSIIENFDIECKRRHRALDDAKVIYKFYEQSKAGIQKDLFNKAVMMVLRRPSVPIGINSTDIDNLPEAAGVYIFYGDNGSILYIGKSINIRERVLSHFSNDHLSLTDMKISQQARSVEAIETAGELSALLLESTLIKNHRPLYNRMLRDAQKVVVLLKGANAKGYSTGSKKILDKVPAEQATSILGVFRSERQLNDFLYNLAKENKLCPKLLGLDKSTKHCFYYHLGQCNGACCQEESSLKYNLRFEQAFYKTKLRHWIFDSPVLIKEKGNKEEIHLVDKWCYLGSVKKGEEGNIDLNREYRFDLDTYKILVKYMMNPRNQKNISPLRPRIAGRFSKVTLND